MTAKERIQPPAYQPSEVEHKAAYYRKILEYLCYDLLIGIDMVHLGQLKNTILENELETIYKINEGPGVIQVHSSCRCSWIPLIE